MRKKTAKGKSHSKRPANPEAPSWINVQPEVIEKMIVELAKKGYSQAMIGQILRDQEGIPLVKPILGKSISQVLKDHGIEKRIPDDLEALIAHAERTIKHLEQHPKDKASLRGLEITESKIHRLVKYYKRKGILPPDWKYKPRAASFI
ncbi:30S ribosomal protein S15 [Candidatus Marsarchaeota G2 archaeon ECH_B_SAG-F08]|jgi:SSU ribosomal protein S15P|uniref:Small ribosomal subunit protein uS15 n=6 Tax=Candidatus Marsarchaeota TaxID=1978152 RepID=A0A2R6AK42_9ARCH|nr:MAG: 30S ribosomal protein S15 [Candidatus Marsarchaeota G1 archaeon BE_D]PSN89640.1 MAG: 30S ribosomal protein S15 [Candidatus Marsarchaeota G1 archaeon OSP_B]PSN89716.1 MAG: 30S ribosomal protein S15 [Candidatus Marsarchaeota G1 archaeon OSP_C]PSN97907.1 MAG: 30S ribosomal protein S15 [Candidatus Marsarchaeota G2 archaeon ECH_B_SAG-F08]PSO02939.1 MAG: 30S ribosomal protein S15 [Candidatus Marsarchaeota G2 archaeon ECH_B_SAG-E12]PSO03825.1 MAG: 30S ribosomal protein S15 [Candidatus Marsarc